MIRSIRPYMSQSSLVNIYYSVSFSTFIWCCILRAGNQHQEAFYTTKKGSPLNDRVWVQAFMSKPLQTAWNFTIKVSVHLFGFAVSKNWKLFTTNHDVHNPQTRHRNDLHLPTFSLSLYQK
jgi:hypothetical protein